MVAVIVLSAVGFALSLYAFFLDRKIRENPDYKAVCDISDSVSCTKPIVSGYGNLFGFSNSILGILFYPLLALLAYFNQIALVKIATSGLLLVTAYLASILFAKVKALCPVCIAIYVVNITLFAVALSL